MIVMATGPAVATYDPATDHWSKVVAPPAIDRFPEAAWIGGEVILWDSRQGSRRAPRDGGVADPGWRWAPGRSAWEPLPPLPAGSRIEVGSMGWTGNEIMVWGESTSEEGTGTGALWRPDENRWRPISACPQGRVDPYDGTPGSQAITSDVDRKRVIVRALQGNAEATGQTPTYTYSPTTNRWTSINIDVPGYHPLITVARDKILVPDPTAPFLGTVPP